MILAFEFLTSNHHCGDGVMQQSLFEPSMEQLSWPRKGI